MGDRSLGTSNAKLDVIAEKSGRVHAQLSFRAKEQIGADARF